MVHDRKKKFKRLGVPINEWEILNTAAGDAERLNRINALAK